MNYKWVWLVKRKTGCVIEADNQTQHGHQGMNVILLFIFYIYCDAAPQTKSDRGILRAPI